MEHRTVRLGIKTNLTIDIGNTRAKLVAFTGERTMGELLTDGRTLQDMAGFAEKMHCQRAIVSSTIGLTEEARRQLAALPFPVKHLSHLTPLPIRNHYRTPETLGPDRLAAVVGAWSLRPKRDSLVIDVGTCITYDIIDSLGNYLGGNISPGMRMRLRAMHEQTDRLPLVDLDGELPETGKDTETALRCGVRNGVQYEVEHYILSMRRRFPRLQAFITGGDAPYLHLNLPKAAPIIFNSQLVSLGLNSILLYNS